MKRTCIAVALVLLPSIAVAQPYDPSGGPPPPPPGEPPPPPPGGAPPPPGYNTPPPGPQPGYAQPASTIRRGMTFEANIGLGFTRLDVSGETLNGDAALAGLNLGIGGWINPRMNVTARIAGVQFKREEFEGADETIVNAFFGPSLQYWIDDHAWIGGGVGFATFRAVGGDSDNDDGVNGFGFDLRGGYSFGGNTNHSFNVSVELNPCFYDEDGESATITSFAFLVGYQYL